MLVLLSGAKKNAGDFLITRSAEILVHEVLGEEIVRLPSWESLDPHVDLISQARAVIVSGGPGYQKSMYPGVYPLFSDPATVSKLGKPIVFLGLGWYGDPGDDWDLRHLRFSAQTTELLQRAPGLFRFSARDWLSHQFLLNNGINRSVMTGCPVWYEHESLGVAIRVPSAVSRIVFTPPAQTMFFEQSKRLLAGVIDRFPGAEVICAFHRGIQADPYTSRSEAQLLQEHADFAERAGALVEDVSYDLAGIDSYRDADLHVGYRLHAHLFFLRVRKPTIIMEEDGRARGAAEALGTPSVRAWEYTRLAREKRALMSSPLSKWAEEVVSARGKSGHRGTGGARSQILPEKRAAKRALSAMARVKRPSRDAAGACLALLNDELASDFAGFSHVAQKIDSSYPSMKSFLESI
jgi:hypothetical protein